MSHPLVPKSQKSWGKSGGQKKWSGQAHLIINLVFISQWQAVVNVLKLLWLKRQLYQLHPHFAWVDCTSMPTPNTTVSHQMCLYSSQNISKFTRKLFIYNCIYRHNPQPGDWWELSSSTPRPGLRVFIFIIVITKQQGIVHVIFIIFRFLVKE